MSGSDPAAEAGVAAGQQAAALGRNQIQAATVVGQGTDPGQAGLYVPSDAPYCPIASVALTASRAMIVRFVAPKSLSITKAAISVSVIASANDNCDVAILDSTLTKLLGGSGSIAGKLNALGVQVINLVVPVSLVGGAVYYAAFSSGPQGGTPASLNMTNIPTLGSPSQMFGAGAPFIEQSFQSGVFPLAVPITPGGPITNCPILALLQ
jgi:hypothetical protein